MQEEIAVIKIIPDSVSVNSKASPSSSGGGAGGGLLSGMSDMLEGVLKAIGIGSVVGIALMIVSHFKSLIGVVSNIIKMVAYIIKPIADVVMMLLMPILIILKPIMQLANQIMAPFLKLSMQVMREGMKMMAEGNIAGGAAAMAGAGGIAMAGLNSVILGLLGGLINVAIDLAAQMLSQGLQALVGLLAVMLEPLFNIFGASAIEKIQGLLGEEGTINKFIMGGADIVKDTIAMGIGTAMAEMIGMATMLGETFGVETKEFQDKAMNNIKTLFNPTDGLVKIWEDQIGMKEGFGKMAKDSIDGVLTGPDGIENTFSLGMDNFKDTGKAKIASAVDAFNAEFDRMRKASSSSGGGGFWSVVKDAATEVITAGRANTNTYG
jgi:hypothetical protein